MRKTSIIYLTALFVACQPQYDMVPPESIVPVKQEFEENWYVSKEGLGAKDGSDWDNALPFNDLLDALTSDASSFANAGIHLQEGTYTIPTGEESAIQLACNVLCIRGGYSKDLESDDLEDCDASKYPTVFTGENGFAKVSGVSLLFENIKFSGFKASVFTIDGDHSTTSVECHNCIFDGNTSSITANASAGGPCAYIANGYFKAKNCVFTNNSAVSRGGAIRSNSRTAVVYLDRCYFKGNKLEKEWGLAVQCSAGVLCANNCTMIGNTGNGSTLNGGGAFFIANSTIIDDSNPNGANNAAFRCESKEEAKTTLINNVLSSSKDGGYGIILNAKGIINSKGYNVIKSVYLGSGSVDPCISTDLKNNTIIEGQADESSRCWIWDFNQISSSFLEFAVLDDIYDRAVDFDPSAYCEISLVGRSFATWVTPNAFSVDGRGVERDSDGFIPGSYEPSNDSE